MNNQKKQPKPWYKAWWFWVLVVVVIFVLGGMMSDDSDDSSKSDSSSSSSKSSLVKDSSKSQPKVPAEYKNALESAKTYVYDMNMSKKGTYEQLKSKAGDQFSSKAAYWAVNHLTNVNWNEIALKSAKDYEKQQHMSPNAIRDQLVSSAGEQFTQSQAVWAVQHLDK